MSPSTPAEHDNATVATALRMAWVELLWTAWHITCALKAIPNDADDATYGRFNTGVARELWEAINVMGRITAVDTMFRSSTAPGTLPGQPNVKPIHLLLHDIKWSGLSVSLDLRQVNRAKVIASLVVLEDVVEFFHDLNSSAAYPWFDTTSAAVTVSHRKVQRPTLPLYPVDALPVQHWLHDMVQWLPPASQRSLKISRSITSAENMFKNRALQIVRAIKMLDDDIPEDEPDTLA
ncbi:hypothetical protein BD310DRAFT_908522 [Dichomitus squalens]|uniref:Uncharacterized protein n=1 Tax=Dichomitus squalens TaxID=114155 RepID=A0A4Q9PLZ7_9APHY|nr:hypothetical protein BD310DRAFT_908522 [Dichomitus squalens]